MGKCPDCGAWDALEKFIEPASTSASTGGGPALAESWVLDEHGGGIATATAKAIALPEIAPDEIARITTGVGEFDRVLGGGLVPGSLVLLGGEPGIGKSTLLLQAACSMARPAKGSAQRVMYVASEESAQQVRMRAERLIGEAQTTRRRHDRGSIDGLHDLLVLADTNLVRIVEQARLARPRLLVIDSIQMVYKPDLAASPGSVTQLRHCTTDLACIAKVSGMAIVIVGHVTKEGQLAGPKLLEHLVDTVLSFEGDRHHAHRVVRASKNRFGPTLEVGLFEMTPGGLTEIADASALLNPDRSAPSGSVIAPIIHGSRCLMVEIQALTATGFLGSAKRRASGLDPNRLAMLIAVLEKHGGLRLADQDVFASAAGGLKVIEPSADLAIAVAIAGAHLRQALPAGTAVIGEVGLGGEVRPLRSMEHRVRECQRCGCRTIIIPRAQAGQVSGPINAVGVDHVGEAVAQLEPVASPPTKANSSRAEAL
jgi:DNA repair protein RadA/Sms